MTEINIFAAVVVVVRFILINSDFLILILIIGFQFLLVIINYHHNFQLFVIGCG